MLEKCICYIRYEDGTGQISLRNLKDGLPFSLKEMEKWIMEQSKKAVKGVKCYEIPANDNIMRIVGI